MKAIIQTILQAFVGHAMSALGCPGEFGDQSLWPAVTAASDLRSYQYRAVRFAAAQTCNVASNDVSAAATEIPSGILQNNPNSGQPASIAYAGLTKAWAGDTITARALLTTNGSGKVVDAGSGDIVFARAMEAGAADDRISVLVFPPVRWASVA